MPTSYHPHGAVALLLMLSTLSAPPAASADKTTLNTNVGLANLMESGGPASEPFQRAIVLWNGEEEILVLSTDLYRRVPTEVLEHLSLPAEPTTQLASIRIFAEATAIAAEKGAVIDGLAPAPDARIGAIRSLHVMALRSESEYVTHVTQQQRELGLPIGLHDGLISLAGRYQKKGFFYFVFDTVFANEQQQSFQPIEYRFRTDKLFYPLETSIYNVGNTQVDLLLITSRPLAYSSETDYPKQHRTRFYVDATDLSRLSPGWGSFFQYPRVTAEHVRISGNIQRMRRDLIAH